MPQGGARWVFGGFRVGRTTHRVLIWDGRRKTALVVKSTGYGFVTRQTWTWEGVN